jgi:hypothetical protein
MTTQRAVDIFNIIQDTYGSPYINTDEAVMYLNLATNEWLNRLVPDSQGGVVNFEFDANTADQVKPLLYELNIVNITSALVSDERINLALQTATDDDCAELFKILSVGVDNGSRVVPAKYVKHNNFWVNYRNIFKSPTADYPVYTYHAQGYKFYPTPSSTSTVKFMVMRKPKKLALNPNPVDPDFDDYTMYTIIMLALKMAGVATRDEELIGAIRATALQGSN